MRTTKIELQENSFGELFFEMPPDLLDYLDWKKGDDLKFTDHKNGVITIKNVKYSTVKLDIDDDNLLRYMKYAHERGMTFNELAQEAVKDFLIKSDFESECG
jgi:hypothetical protein